MGGVRVWGIAAAVAAALVLVATGSGASVVPTPISADPYTNGTSQHATQVEPDSFGWENTVVAAFQTGRFFDGGASNIGWATTTDGGNSWTTGMLPGTTVFQGGPWARISDPAVAYDPMHDVWMISTLAINASGSGAAVLTSRSTDGGLTWQNPVTVSLSPGTFYDKNWIGCDTWAQSPHYGNCYTEWDDNGLGNLLQMSTSTDGGATWGPIRVPAGSPSGLGGQPVVQPNGNVVVPYSGNFSSVNSFRSTDGGDTWVDDELIASAPSHNVAAGLRTSPLPSAEVDADGKVYVVWQDCRFRSGCTANDIVMSTSTDGVTWSAVTRIPIDPTTSGVDHFIPGIAVDRTTAGNTAKLALGYYYYPVSACTLSTCDLTVGFVSSLDGGATWTAPTQVSGAMKVTWVANTSQGRMVGDYMSTSFAAGSAHPVFAIAKLPNGSVFSERMAAARFDVDGPQLLPRRRAGGDKPVYLPRNGPRKTHLVRAY